MATKEGIVRRIEATTAWISTTRNSACETCSAKGSCSTLERGEKMEVKALNTVQAQVGDRVAFSVQNRSLLKLAFLLYIFPILALFAGALSGQELAPFFAIDATLLSVILAFSFFLLAFGLARAIGKRLARKEAYQTKIIRILNTQGMQCRPVQR